MNLKNDMNLKNLCLDEINKINNIKDTNKIDEIN